MASFGFIGSVLYIFLSQSARYGNLFHPFVYVRVLHLRFLKEENWKKKVIQKPSPSFFTATIFALFSPSLSLSLSLSPLLPSFSCSLFLSHSSRLIIRARSPPPTAPPIPAPHPRMNGYYSARLIESPKVSVWIYPKFFPVCNFTIFILFVCVIFLVDLVEKIEKWFPFPGWRVESRGTRAAAARRHKGQVTPLWPLSRAWLVDT